MCSVLVIVCILFKISDSVKDSDIIAQLFSMLHLMPENVPNQIPLDLKFIMSFIPDQYYPDVATALIHFAKKLMLKNKLECVVYVIPLIHFLKKKVLPCAKPEVKSDLIKWTDEDFELDQSTKIMSW